MSARPCFSEFQADAKKGNPAQQTMGVDNTSNSQSRPVKERSDMLSSMTTSPSGAAMSNTIVRRRKADCRLSCRDCRVAPEVGISWKEKPSDSIVSRNCRLVGPTAPWPTRASRVARLTSADVTPGRFRSDCSTRPTQPAQCIPSARKREICLSWSSEGVVDMADAVSCYGRPLPTLRGDSGLLVTAESLRAKRSVSDQPIGERRTL